MRLRKAKGDSDERNSRRKKGDGNKNMSLKNGKRLEQRTGGTKKSREKTLSAAR